MNFFLHILELSLNNTSFPTKFSHKNFPEDFPTEFPARFPTRISHKNFPQDLPARFSRKIFPSWILIGWLPITLFQMLNFHQSLPFLNWLFPLQPVPQDFPTKFSCKIFLQDFPTRFSHKIFPQDFPELDPDWLAPITLFQMLNFHQSLLC